MNKAQKILKTFIFPEKCPFCCRAVRYNETICHKCAEEVECEPFEVYAKGGYKCVSPFFYKGIYKEALRMFKFKNCFYNDKNLSLYIEDSVTRFYGGINFDCVTWVPMHRIQKRKRGYDQAELLSKQLGKKLALPCRRLLIKHTQNRPQHELAGSERRQNVKGVYKAVNTDKYKCETVLLVDDVITTGYTLGECCKTLSKAGVKHIYCAVLCSKNNV